MKKDICPFPVFLVKKYSRPESVPVCPLEGLSVNAFRSPGTFRGICFLIRISLPCCHLIRSKKCIKMQFKQIVSYNLCYFHIAFFILCFLIKVSSRAKSGDEFKKTPVL